MSQPQPMPTSLVCSTLLVASIVSCVCIMFEKWCEQDVVFMVQSVCTRSMGVEMYSAVSIVKPEKNSTRGLMQPTTIDFLEIFLTLRVLLRTFFQIGALLTLPPSDARHLGPSTIVQSLSRHDDTQGWRKHASQLLAPKPHLHPAPALRRLTTQHRSC